MRFLTLPSGSHISEAKKGRLENKKTANRATCYLQNALRGGFKK
jgi:hypothetical protein